MCTAISGLIMCRLHIGYKLRGADLSNMNVINRGTRANQQVLFESLYNHEAETVTLQCTVIRDNVILPL